MRMSGSMEVWGTVSYVFLIIVHFLTSLKISLCKGCWVLRKVFKTEQLVTEYVWLWASLCFMASLYIIMFAVMRGWFIVEKGVWYWYKNYLPTDGAGQPVEETKEEKDSKTIARLLLL